MSRNFLGYVSAYRSAQAQPILVRRPQTRILTVDWKGAVPVGDTIASVTWSCTSPWITAISDASIDGLLTKLKVAFNYGGIGNIRASITTSAGEQMTYEFEVTVRSVPLYPFEQFGTANGPYSLTASA